MKKGQSIRQLIKEGIMSYTEGSVDKIDIHADPQVEGTYAIRTKHGNDVAYWIVCKLPHDATVGTVVDYLEECEFETWLAVLLTLDIAGKK